MSTPSTRFSSTRFRWTLGLTGLWAFAVAQPLLDLIGGGPEFLLAHRLSPLEIVAGAVLLTIGPPVVAGGVIQLIGRFAPRLAAGLALLCAAVLLFVLALQIGNAVDLGVGSAMGVAALASLGITWLIHRRRGFPVVSVGLSLCALVFILKFTLFSPARGLVLPLAGGSASIPEVPEPRNVVLLVFDELPCGSLLDGAGRVDGTRFPAFARLAAEGTFFSNATAVHNNTSYAVPAILTGRIPDRRRLPTYLDYPRNLFTWLGPTHEIHAVETLTSLCPAYECEPSVARPWRGRLSSLVSDVEILLLHVLYPTAWRADLPPVSGTWRDFRRTVRPVGDDDVTGEEWSERYDADAKVDRFLGGFGQGSSPRFDYLHLELPHIPWRYLPDGREYGPISGSNFAHGVDPKDGRWVGSAWEIHQGLQRHLLQLGYADRLLGRILNALDVVADDALLIVTADHGFSFLPGEPGREPDRNNVGEVLSVPLFLRGVTASGQVPAGRVDSRPARTTDLVATVAAAQGAEAPWKTDGSDLLAAARGEDRPVPFAGAEWEVRRLDSDGARVAIERARQRIATTFPESGIDGLFAIGPHRELIGRLASDLPSRRGERTIALEQPWLFAQAGPESTFLPAHIQGRIVGPSPAPDTTVVVAIDRVVRATSRPYEERGSWHVSAMVPPEAFRPGSNRVELFEVVEPEGELELASWGGTAEGGYRIERDETGRPLRLTASNGSGSAIAEGAVPARLFRQGLTFWGWAHDASFERLTVVMAFVDGELIYATPTNQSPEPGTGSPAAPDGVAIGFRFALPRSLVVDSTSIEIFAVAGDRASRLEL